MSKITDAQQFVGDLGAGTFANQLGAALSAVAQGVVANGKTGKVVISLDIKRIGDSSQVSVSHKLAFTEPTGKGSRSEDTTSETPMHLNMAGDVTLFATHTNQMFDLEKSMG